MEKPRVSSFSRTTEPFDTEQAALDEALKAIETDGVDFAAESFPYLLE